MMPLSSRIRQSVIKSSLVVVKRIFFYSLKQTLLHLLRVSLMFRPRRDELEKATVCFVRVSCLRKVVILNRRTLLYDLLMIDLVKINAWFSVLLKRSCCSSRFKLQRFPFVPIIVLLTWISIGSDEWTPLILLLLPLRPPLLLSLKSRSVLLQLIQYSNLCKSVVIVWLFFRHAARILGIRKGFNILLVALVTLHMPLPIGYLLRRLHGRQLIENLFILLIYLLMPSLAFICVETKLGFCWLLLTWLLSLRNPVQLIIVWVLLQELPFSACLQHVKRIRICDLTRLEYRLFL